MSKEWAIQKLNEHVNLWKNGVSSVEELTDGIALYRRTLDTFKAGIATKVATNERIERINELLRKSAANLTEVLKLKDDIGAEIPGLGERLSWVVQSVEGCNRFTDRESTELWCEKTSDIEAVNRQVKDFEEMIRFFELILELQKTIRDEYEKTEDDRKKPVVRKLKRICSDIANAYQNGVPKFEIEGVDGKDLLSRINTFKDMASKLAKRMKEGLEFL